MNISHKYKLIFVHVPKTGGTSLAKALGINRNHLYAKQLKEKYKEYWDNYYTFSFARNPWDRMVSVFFYYRDGVEEHNKHVMNNIPQNFNDFIHEFYDKKREWYNALYVQQYDWLSEKDEILVDYVYRFEDFREETNKIFNKFKIKTKLPHIRKSVHENYRTYYNENTIKLVGEMFDKDVEYFNYEF